MARSNKPTVGSEYHGRLACDGFGNLLADEGDYQGYPVAATSTVGSYAFIGPDDPSHNERHHRQFASMTSTAQHEFEGGNMDDNQHHFGVLEDDPHYEEGATSDSGVVTNTRLRTHPEIVAHTMTGHTDAWTE